MENFPNWKYNLPNLCSFEALSLEKVHNYFGFLLTYSYLCNRQESINKPNRRKIGANAFLRNAENAHKQRDTQRN